MEETRQVVNRNEFAWKRLESISHIVFVNSLLLSMTKLWLWQLFNYEGRVVDIFISYKKRKTCDVPFAFLRFAHLKNAPDAICN